ncbi:MAG: hypothetical protein IH584_05400, partial [Candidatus Aminicenantes bacterium]|nr:hypothetical protein [Candidatus Aminicenantes bacterium]
CMVRAQVSGGHGSVSPGSQQVEVGATAMINIAADPGYMIDTIMDNNTSKLITNPYIISNVKEDHNVVVTFVPEGYPPTLEISAVRKSETSWLIDKDYGEITLNITEHPTKPIVISKYVLYRIENGSTKHIADFTGPGTITYQDKYLEKDKTYQYKLVAVDASSTHGAVVAESEVVTI